MSRVTPSKTLTTTWRKAGSKMLGQLEVMQKLNQERLEKIRQEIRIHALLKAQQPSLRLRTAKALEHLAYKLSPELEAYPLQQKS